MFVPFVEKTSALAFVELSDPDWKVKLLVAPLNVKEFNPEKVMFPPLARPPMVVFEVLSITKFPPVIAKSPLPPTVVAKEDTDCVLFPRFNVPALIVRFPEERRPFAPRVTVPL